MAGTTSNFSLPYPDNSDPVNVAGDIQSLATQADSAIGSELAGKANSSHTHVVSNVTGLQTALDGKQPLDADLSAISALSGTGYLERTGTNTWQLNAGSGGGGDHGSLTGLADDDHTQYLRVDGTRALTGDISLGNNKITLLGTPSLSTDAASKGYVDINFQPLDGDLSSISSLTGTGFLERTGTDTWALSNAVSGNATYGQITVTWNGTNWRYNGATITSRPTTASYNDGAFVYWDTSQDITVTSPPSLAVAGDKWHPHPDAEL